MDFKKEITYFSLTQDCAFATSYENSPHVRPMCLMLVDNNFYLATGAKSRKIIHLQANNKYELYAMLNKDDNVYHVQAKGEAEIISDLNEKEKVFAAVEMIKCYWSAATDPECALIKLNMNSINLLHS